MEYGTLLSTSHPPQTPSTKRCTPTEFTRGTSTPFGNCVPLQNDNTNPKKPPPRFDFFFSYWIFAWFLLYAIKATKYNPKIFIIGALLENIIYVSLMVYYKNSLLYIFLFVLANIIIKILPLWWLWNTEYKLQDLVAGIVLFIIYTIWLYSNDFINNNELGVWRETDVPVGSRSFPIIFRTAREGVYKKIESTIDGIKRNEPTTPFTYFIVKGIGA